MSAFFSCPARTANLWRRRPTYRFESISDRKPVADHGIDLNEDEAMDVSKTEPHEEHAFLCAQYDLYCFEVGRTLCILLILTRRNKWRNAYGKSTARPGWI